MDKKAIVLYLIFNVSSLLRDFVAQKPSFTLMENVVIFKNLIVLWQIIYNTSSNIYIAVWHALGTLLSYYLHVFCWSFLKYISLILWYTFITWLWTQIVNKTVWVYHNYKETEKLPMSVIKVLYHSLLRWETYYSLMLRIHFRKTYCPLSPNSETCWREDDCFVLVSF